MPLGLAALSLGYITPEQLQVAVRHQQRNGSRIGEVLVSLGFASQSQVTASLARQWGHPVLSLQNRQLSVAQRIPTRLLELYSMLPIHFVEQTNKLVLGFSELVEHRILSTVETMLGCTVIPCFITPDDFSHHFQAVKQQQSSINEEVLFEQRSNLQEIARITRSYAWQIGALSARFGMCSDYLWSRLQGPQVSIDVLSKI
jgi:hypothetical protein